MSPKLLFKRLLKTTFFRALLCWLIACYIRFVYATSRKRVEIDTAAQPYVDGKKPALFAFWHGRLLMIAPLCPKGRKMHGLMSTHRDGEMIASTMRHFGLGMIRGSSTHGGATAAMNAVKALQAGDNLCITPDGPRGPAMQIQPGLLSIAELAGVPVIPVSYSATRHKRVKSWDSFMVALPFGSLYYKVGAPMVGVTKEALEKSMIELTEEVDKG